MKYYDTGSKRIDNKSLDYQEILEVKYDEAQKTCAVKVKSAAGSTKEITISLEKGETHKFDEALIGSLYIPAGIVVDAKSEATS